jgi:hypothetical protein
VGLGVGGRARSHARVHTVREACDLEAPVRRPLLDGGDLRWPGRRWLRCPKEYPDVLGEILISHLLSPHPPTHRVLPSSHSFRPELISSLPAA